MTERFYTPVNVPDGEYGGRWSAHEINFECEGREVNVGTAIGVRGLDIPCTFRIVDGKLDQESIETQ